LAWVQCLRCLQRVARARPTHQAPHVGAGRLAQQRLPGRDRVRDRRRVERFQGLFPGPAQGDRLMCDVIVVGAGGGGPVMAKELAAHGLDVLLLEAGAHWDKPETDWTHFENDANNPLTGYLRFGPRDRSQPAWYRE